MARLYKILGSLYGDYDFTKEFYQQEVVDEKEWIIEAESLDDAEIWFCENHPEYFMGGAVTCITEGVCEFCMLATPNPYEYKQGMFETVANRVKYAKRWIQFIEKRRRAS